MGKILLSKKLIYRSDYRFYTRNVPQEIEFEIGFNSEKRVESPKDASYVLIFTTRSTEMESTLAELATLGDLSRVLWLAFPKKHSQISSDLTRDRTWDYIRRFGFDGASLISINSDWSGVRLRKVKTESPRNYKPIGREGARKVNLPASIRTALDAQNLLDKFDRMPFSRQRFFVDAYNKAVKHETKLKRIQDLTEYLIKHH